MPAKHMKYRSTLTCLFLVLFAGSVLAADPAAPTHWYSITISEGASPRTLTGSSSLDPEHLGATINGGTLIELGNLRSYGIASDGAKTEWQNMSEGLKLFLLPRTVLYFSELSGDPLVASK